MPDGDTLQQNWASAVQTYRTALVAYRRLLEVRASRGKLEHQTSWSSSRQLPVRIASFPPKVACRLDGLTPRERDVAQLVARGYSNQQIAEELVLTRGTVANHVAHILGKLGLTNRTQIAAKVLDTISRSA